MRKLLFVVAACAASAGCSHPVNDGVVVTPEIVRSYAQMCAPPVTYKPRPGDENGGTVNLLPRGYVYAGFDFVDQECLSFFDNIVLLQKNARYSSSMVTTANATTAAILALVKASAVSIAIVASGTELIRKVIEGYAAEYAFAPYALETRAVVFDAMSAYRSHPDTISLIANLPAPDAGGYCVAQNVVRNYAKICSIANIEALARQAIANPTIRGTPPVSRAPSAPSGQSVPATPAGWGTGSGLPNFRAGN